MPCKSAAEFCIAATPRMRVGYQATSEMSRHAVALWRYPWARTGGQSNIGDVVARVPANGVVKFRKPRRKGQSDGHGHNPPGLAHLR